MTTEKEWLYDRLRQMEQDSPTNPTPLSTPSDAETSSDSPSESAPEVENWIDPSESPQS